MNTTNGIQPGHLAAMQMMQQPPNGAMRPGVAKNGFEDQASRQKKHLNTAIYDYFLRVGAFDIARNMRNDSSFEMFLNDTNAKVDEEDENKPADLPAPGLPLFRTGAGQSSFLLEWYSMFMDMFTAGGKNSGSNTLAAQYLQHNLTMSRMQQQRTQVMLQQGMTQGMNPNLSMQLRQNMMNPAGRPMGPNMGMGSLQQRQAIAVNAARMAREAQAGEGDNRPRTPSSGENAPSPPKRPRLDGNPAFNGQGMAPGMMVPGGMNADPRVANAHNLLQAHGLNPSSLTPAQLHTFQQQNAQVQDKSIQVYKASMATHTLQHQRASMGGQGSPNMMTPPSGMDMQQIASNGDFYGNNNAARMQNGNNGHALQDYQMQLMLLERQNRKRLEMAKQEHDGMGNGPNPPNAMIPGFAPNMSPSGSRQGGPSPNPNEQIKRTPQMSKVPIPGGSPMPDGAMQNRASPAATMNYNQMPPGMENSMTMGPNGMRPPSSHPPNFNGQMNPQSSMMRGQPGGPGQNPNFAGQQGPMGPGGQSGPVPGQMGTPQPQRNPMPPPSGVPPTNQNATGRAPSPAPSAAAGTPQQSNKPAPKKAEKKKKASAQPNKKGAAGATPAESNDNAPATSAPATPITPAMNGGPFEKNKAAGGSVAPNGPNANPGGNQPNGAPSAGQPQPPAAVTGAGLPQPDANVIGGGDPSGSMGDFNMPEAGFPLEFTGLEAADVLDNFDFNQFIDEGNNGGTDFNGISFDLPPFGDEMGGTVDV